jgi:hypothetical protein
MRKLGLTFALLLAGLVPAAALAGGDDDDAVTVVSGAGTELSRDGGATWRPAVMVSPYRLWAAPLAGSEWVSVSANRGLRPAGVGLRARYRRAFRLSDCGEGSLTLRLHVDNDARVFLNLNGTRIGSTPAGPLPANFQGTPLVFEADGPLRDGRNVLEFRVSDQGIVTGLDFKGVVTCDDDDGDDDDGGDDDDRDDGDDEERDNG